MLAAGMPLQPLLWRPVSGFGVDASAMGLTGGGACTEVEACGAAAVGGADGAETPRQRRLCVRVLDDGISMPHLSQRTSILIIDTTHKFTPHTHTY